jgi:PPP family 3-phenylpropionic acid transporter
MERLRRGVLISFLTLFAALYAGFGVQSPYLPALLQDHGLAAEAIGVVLASATAIRLAAGPIAGRLADRFDAIRLVFAACAGAAALAAMGYAVAHGLPQLLLVSLVQAAALAPLAPLCDALVLPAAGPQRGLNYGWMRGAGSAAFIAGSVVSGYAVGRYGLVAVIWLNAALLAGAACYAPIVPLLPPQPPATAEAPADESGGAMRLWRLAPFRRVVLVAALILGSHALHDGFAMIRWNAAGIQPGTAGILWSESVAAEIVVFVLIGRPILDRFGTSGAATLAAFASILRWAVSAETATLPAIAAIQPLHGITFALLHLACLRRLAETVPPHLSATALTLYGTVGIGAASALLTLISGWLYGAIGANGFWAMAALSATALPVARKL